MAGFRIAQGDIEYSPGDMDTHRVTLSQQSRISAGTL
jgi:hypothetical protein